MMNRHHPLLTELENALDAHAWDEAVQLLRTAQTMGLTHSKYGIPLHYILTDLPNRQTIEADKEAATLMATAATHVAAGQYAQARQSYTQAEAIPMISAAQKEQIVAALAALDDLINYGAPQDPVIEHQLESMMAKLLADIKQQQPSLATLLSACAIPLWWDEKLLAVIRNRQDDRESAIQDKLNRFSFVYVWSDHYTYSRLARRMLLRLWEEDDTGFQQINGRILAYLQERLDVNPPQQPAAYERLTQAHLYHTFLADPAQGVARLGELMQKAEDDYRLEDARQYIWVLKELQPYLPDEYSAWINYAEGWLHHLNQRDVVAQQMFQQLLSATDLPVNLRARVERGLALALIARQDWVAAASHLRTALALFQQQNQSSEVAETMINLGDAYLDIAQTAYGHTDEFDLDVSWSSQFSNLVSFVARLPLILFLVWKLELVWDVRVWWKLGRNMDWVVARLFSDAILWFRQAEAVYQKLGDKPGLQRANIRLGRLYLALNHPTAAATIFHQLATDAPPESYQKAYICLELAEALLRQGMFAEAEDLLQQALPIFTRINHTPYIAQTQSRLGHIATHNQQWDVAMTAYRSTLQAWQQLGNTTRATDTRHAMEALGRNPNVPTAVRDNLSHIQPPNAKRVYETRFGHPVMAQFQRFASILLWIAIFIALLTSIRSDAGTKLGADATLKRPTQAEAVAAFSPTVGVANEQEVFLAIEKQVTPQFRSRFLGTTLAGVLAAYLSLYTVVGLILIVTTPMRNVQAQQRRRLEFNHETIDEFENDRLAKRLHWADVQSYVTNHRLIFGKLVEIVSSVTILGSDNYINISARLRHYWTVTHHQLQRLLPPQTPQVNTGYTLPYGFLGWLLVTTLTLLMAFVILVVTDSPWATTPLPFLSYAPAELYNLLFVVGALPLLHLFVLQSVRNYLIRQPQQRLVSNVAFISLLLGVASVLQFRSWHLPLGRPDLLLSAVTLLLASFALHQHIVLAPRGNRLRVYASGSIIVIIVAISCAVWSMRQELRSFRVLSQANAQFLQAEQTLKDDGEKAANDTLLEALDLYTTTLTLRREPYVYNSQANVYIRLKEYEKAIQAYQEAQQGDPADLSIQLNLALAYREWASETQDFSLRDERYRQAVDVYDNIIYVSQSIPNLNREESANLWSAHELRAATWFELGRMYYNREQNDLSLLDYFIHAIEDYNWLIATNPDDPAGYVGKGWSLLYLRIEYPLADRAARRQYFEDAIKEFSTAIDKDPKYSPAYNGLGWMHWYISNEGIAGNCINGIDEALKPDYQAQVEAAVDAFTQGTDADDTNGFFFRTRAQLYYILSYCKPDERIDYLREAVADYDLALKNAPSAGWYWRQNTIYQELATNLANAGRMDEARIAREAAIVSNLHSLHEDPNYSRPHRSLHYLYGILGITPQEAYEAIIAAMKGSPQPADFIIVAQDEAARSQWELAIRATEEQLAITPDDERAYLIKAQAFYQLERLQEAQTALQRMAALEVVDPAIIYASGALHVALGNHAEARAAYVRGNRTVGTVADLEVRLSIYATAIKHLLTVADDPAKLAAPLAFTIVDTTIQELTIVTPTADGYFEAGWAAFQDKRYELAVPLLVQAVRLDPTAYRYWNPLRDALVDGYDVGQTESGNAVLTIILGTSPGVDSYTKLVEVARAEFERDTFGLAEFERDTFGLAVAALDRALLLLRPKHWKEPENPDPSATLPRYCFIRDLQLPCLEVFLLKAQIYQRWGDKYPTDTNALPRYQLAIENAQQTLTLDSENTIAYLILGHTQRQLGMTAESLTAYQNALDRGAADEATGWVAYLSGDYAAAAMAWGDAIAHNAGEPSNYFNQGIAFIALGDEAAAQQSYDAGLAAIAALEAPVQRDVQLYTALADLFSTQLDPENLVGRYKTLLESKRQ